MGMALTWSWRPMLVDDEPLAGGELAPHDGAAQGLVDVLLLGPERHVGAASEGHGTSARP